MALREAAGKEEGCSSPKRQQPRCEVIAEEPGPPSLARQPSRRRGLHKLPAAAGALSRRAVAASLLLVRPLFAERGGSLARRRPAGHVRASIIQPPARYNALTPPPPPSFPAPLASLGRRSPRRRNSAFLPLEAAASAVVDALSALGRNESRSKRRLRARCFRRAAVRASGSVSRFYLRARKRSRCSLALEGRE